jgi:hypothetical protein
MLFLLPCLILAALLFITPRDNDANVSHYIKRIGHAILCAPLSLWVGGNFSDVSGWDYGAAFPAVVFMVVSAVFFVRIFWFSGALIIYLIRKG